MSASDRSLSSAEAIQRAIDTAEGRLSEHHNLMLQVEPGAEHRQQTLLLIAQATAAEVETWTTLAVGLRQIEMSEGGLL